MAQARQSQGRRRATEQPDVGVIAAKLAPRRLPTGAVSRPRLVDQLRSGRGQTLTLVSAPAGFGKTTLLAEWVDAEPDTSFAWVGLDAGDTEPVRLWTHVVAALARFEPAAGTRSLLRLRATPDKLVDAVLPELYDELSEGTAPVVVILDDFHLAESAAVNEQLEAFMRYRPARVQLVVATRSDPALAVGRLRASGDLVEIRSDDLRFEQLELSQFFAGMGVHGLTTVEERRLAERTGGWPAPVRLAALLMPTDGRASFIDSFTGGHRQVVDYLTRDVLDLLKPGTREFLLQVSILSRLNGSLCDAVVDSTGSGTLLADLERSGLFVSVDSAGEWYQEHHLFAEALRLELTRTRPELVPVLHARAARWFEAAGDRETATDHAIAAHDVATASRLVASQVQQMASTGRGATTQRWLAALSWPEAEQDPELAFVRALAASLEHRIDLAIDYLDLARTGPPDKVDQAGLTLGFRVDFLEGIAGMTQLGRAEAAARRAIISAPSEGWRAWPRRRWVRRSTCRDGCRRRWRRCGRRSGRSRTRTRSCWPWWWATSR